RGARRRQLPLAEGLSPALRPGRSPARGPRGGALAQRPARGVDGPARRPHPLPRGRHGTARAMSAWLLGLLLAGAPAPSPSPTPTALPAALAAARALLDAGKTQEALQRLAALGAADDPRVAQLRGVAEYRA